MLASMVITAGALSGGLARLDRAECLTSLGLLERPNGGLTVGEGLALGVSGRASPGALCEKCGQSD